LLFIIVNVYLPSSSLPEAEYDEALCLLSTIISTYSNEAAVLLVGDWNSSLYRETSRDKKLQTFCQTDGLVPAVHTDSQPSYHGYNGSVSKIDYILAHTDSCIAHGLYIEDIKMTAHICKDENPYVISTHDALCFETTYQTENIEKHAGAELQVQSVGLVPKHIDWENADISKYQAMLESFLGQNFDIWTSPEHLQILAAVIPTSFTMAAELSAPSKENKKSSYKIFKSEEWLKAEILAKNAPAVSGSKQEDQEMKRINYF
jgi:hypothetical protein